MDSHLKKLENDSVYIFRQAYRSINNMAMLWSLGKDSNVMVWLAFKAFFGKIPFPLVHVDTKKKFKEMYEFRDRYEKEWNLNLIKGDCPPVNEIDSSLPPAARSAARKTEGLKNILKNIPKTAQETFKKQVQNIPKTILKTFQTLSPGRPKFFHGSKTLSKLRFY